MKHRLADVEVGLDARLAERRMETNGVGEQ
jgi:hypothetical protein